MYLDNLSNFQYNMDDVWEMKPTERGVKIENYYAATEYRTWYHIGAEYNGYFPVIDFQKDNTVISMKSLDPRLKSYQDEKYLKDTIDKYAKKLSYTPIEVSGIKIPPESKELVIVFPKECITDKLESIKVKLEREYKIKIIYKEI